MADLEQVLEVLNFVHAEKRRSGTPMEMMECRILKEGFGERLTSARKRDRAANLVTGGWNTLVEEGTPPRQRSPRSEETGPEPEPEPEPQPQPQAELVADVPEGTPPPQSRDNCVADPAADTSGDAARNLLDDIGPLSLGNTQAICSCCDVNVLYRPVLTGCLCL